MRSFSLSPYIVLPFSMLLGWAAIAAPPVRPFPPAASQGAPVDFRKQIEPFLKANCAGCHSATAMTSGFSVATVEGLFRGGSKAGAAILPGDSKQSPIIQYLRGVHTPKMPLGGKVSDTAIALIARWIDQGAKVDGKTPAFAVTKGRRQSANTNVPDGWPYSKPIRHAIPSVKDRAWMRNPIDAFILAKLEAKGLKPAPEASRQVLIRRLTFDLLGLPPTPKEIETFLADRSPDAYEKLVNRLLASPQYGEHWARHWLDLARYADTNGYEGDEERSHAWRYRDYVIRAFNNDKPYDRFIEEQIAGTELWPNDPDAVIATGFLRNGPWDSRAFDRRVQRNDFLTDITDTTGAVFLGLTVGCARCHDHKYDPIPQRDYYRLQAFFTQIKQQDLTLPSAPDVRQAAMTVVDAGGTAEKHHVLIRGDVYNPGEEVAPGFPVALAGEKATPRIVPSPDGKSTGRRTALAQWIASPDNPQTARVMMNRLWQYHFGRGIVGTPSDFGRNGEPPTHPKLLDWLATEFVRQGWSLKKMHRLLVTSSAYRQSNQYNASAAKIDPDNRLLWRMNRTRLTGEEIRDSILSISGRLNPKMGGHGVYPALPSEVLDTGSTHKWGQSPPEEQNRRTIYVFQRRSLVLPIVEVFDGADINGSCPCRTVTTIAPQALTLLNGEFTREESRQLAERVTSEVGSAPNDQVNRAFLLALGRLPSPSEQQNCMDFLRKQATTYSKSKPTPELAHASLADLCLVLFNTNDFVYVQ